MSKKSFMKKRISELIRLIENILLQRNISNGQMLYAKDWAEELVQLTKGSSANAYAYLGIINSLLKNDKDAIENFREAIKRDQTLSSTYYGLFQIHMKQKNYKAALEDIHGYEDSRRINDIGANIRVKKGINDRVIDYCGEQDPVYCFALNFAMDELKRGNYEQASRHVKNCIELVNRSSYDMDPCIFENILVKIETQRNERVTELKDEYLKSTNFGIDYLILNNILEFEPNNTNVLILLIETCLSLASYNEAKQYLDIAKSKISFSHGRLKYLEEKLNGLLKQPREYLKSLRNKLSIEQLVLDNKLDEALSLCRRYYEETKDADYIYYLGVLSYNDNNYNDALIYFEQYKSFGVVYLKQTYYYLYYIYNKLADDKKSSYYASLIYQLSGYEGLEISMPTFKKQLLTYESEFSDDSILDFEKTLLGDVLVSESKQKIISIK